MHITIPAHFVCTAVPHPWEGTTQAVWMLKIGTITVPVWMDVTEPDPASRLRVEAQRLLKPGHVAMIEIQDEN